MRFHVMTATALSVACLYAPSATGRTVYDIPSLQECVLDTPVKRVSFDLTLKVLFPRTSTDQTFFATDGTNVIHLVDVTPEPHPHLVANDIIRAQGRTEPEGNLNCLKMQIVGKGRPEPVRDVPIAELVRRNPGCNPVRVHGVIRSVFRDDIDPKWAFVTLYDKGCAIQAIFMPSPDEFRVLWNLIDAEVSVIGIAQRASRSENKIPERGHRRFSPATLFAHSFSNFHIVSPAPQDPFTATALDRSEFVRAGFQIHQRRSAVGHVLAAHGGNRLVLRTDRDEIVNVELSENAAPAFGMRIRAVGYPATDLYDINLTDAIWREEAGASLADSPAEDISLDELLTNEDGLPMIKVGYHGRLIRIRGIVRALPGPSNAEKRLIVESGNSNIPVDVGACPEVLEGLAPGCEAEVSGTCVMSTPNWHPNASPPRIREVFIVLRSPADLKILRRPPWWTPARLFVTLGALLALVVWFVIWNLILRRAVNRRGRELESEITARVESDLKVYERTRLAVELHDSIAQNLTGATMELRTADILADSDPAAMHKYLTLAGKTLDSCREDLRNCIWDLRNLTLDETSVDEAIRKTLEPHAAGISLQIRFNIPREQLTDNTAHTILRIIRELVLNAIRHGKATHIRIAGSVENGKLLFSVRDDGCGFDPAKVPGMGEGHFGLQGIRDRIKTFGGDVEISSKPGSGTKVTVSINIPSPSEKANGT